VLTGRTAIHRKLGTAAVAFAGLMAVVGTATAITVACLGDRGVPGVEFAHPAYVSVVLALGAIPPVMALIASTEAWHRIAAMML
jgi:hypothetical protein